MDPTVLMRRALLATAIYNAIGVLMIALPGSIGQLAGLPVPASPIYSWWTAMLVGLFGAAYAWLARQPQIDRPLVVVAALGKIGFFLIAVACFVRGDVPLRGLLLLSGDILFAAIFIWWLKASKSSVAMDLPKYS